MLEQPTNNPGTSTSPRSSSPPSSADASARSTVTVIGAGYVGLTTAVCLAHLGYTVRCCDIDERKIELLDRGDMPIVEEGLGPMARDAVAQGLLTYHLGVDPAVRDADIVFLCVPTPQDDDGSADLSHIVAAASQIGPILKPDAVVVNKSTVPVGSFHIVGDALQRDDVAVVSNPEFLREGTAVYDFLHPDRIVIGADNEAAAERVRSLYGAIDAKVIITNPSSAEVIKYAANGFLAMKISFINSVAALCEQVDADVASVVEGIGSDPRIGNRFLNPGPGWGGSCFPKDSRALVSISDNAGFDFTLMRGVIEVNEEQYERMIAKVVAAAGKTTAMPSLAGVTVGALGLTFKAGTDDLRESPALRIIDGLQNLGASVRAYDPTTVGELEAHRANRLSGIELCHEPLDVARGADVLVILTEWPEFAKLDLSEVAAVMSGDAVVDCRNILDPAAAREAGLRYDGVGRR